VQFGGAVQQCRGAGVQWLLRPHSCVGANPAAELHSRCAPFSHLGLCGCEPRGPAHEGPPWDYVALS